MYKHTKKIVVVLILITILNLIYSVSHSRRADIGLFKSASSSVASASDSVPISMLGYYHDTKNNFMVIQQQPDPNNDLRDDVASHFWQFMKSDLVSPDTYDMKLINGYAYHEQPININSFDLNSTLTPVELAEHEIWFSDQFIKFFEELLENIKKSDPKISPINNNEHYADSKKENKFPNRDGRIPVYGGHLRENYLEEPIRTKEMLASYLRLSDDEIKALTKSHSDFMKVMPLEFPPDLFKAGKYSHFMQGDGIVYLGGDKYNQLVLLSIKTLRSNGSKLPVEVIIPKRDDFDIDLCIKILPKLNAKCKIMSDYLPESFIKNIKGYQMKNIALLISSFERILYLDADNLPIKNPDAFFTNKPFTNKHMVIWPDLWRRSTSPSYYSIANIDVDLTHRVRNSFTRDDSRGAVTDTEKYSMHDCRGTIPEASSETGQLLINKRVHFKTLILSMYYNYYGPDYYYPLFSQGAAGEGDKETFIAAAHKLDLPYYQVKEYNREFGPINKDSKKHEFFGMGQYDPIIDYIQSQEDDISSEQERVSYYNAEKPKYGKSDTDKDINNYKYHVFQSSSLFFLHANWPKYEVRQMFLQNSFGRGPKDGARRRRLYDQDLLNELQGYDFELDIMKNVHWCFCDLAHINLKDVPDSNSDDRKNICREVSEQIQFLEHGT